MSKEALSEDQQANRNGSDMAYPCEGPNSTAYGLTKRELFAAMAMQTLIGMNAPEDIDGLTPAEMRVGRKAVAFADDLLKELAK